MLWLLISSIKRCSTAAPVPPALPDLSAYRLPLWGNGVDGFRKAMDLVREDVGRTVGLEITGEQGSAVSASAATLRWRMMTAPGSDDRVWTLLWETPVPGDPDTSWAMTTKVCLDAGRASVIVRLGVVTRNFRMRRIPLGVEPPPLVLTLLDALEAQEDGHILAAEPQYACDQEGVGHLADLLFDPGRVLPVVVISSPGRDLDGRRMTGPLINPEPVARSLAAVAHVVVLDSPATSRALTVPLGTRLTVYGGAVRLYWPGLTPDSRPRDHPLWLQDALGASGMALRRDLLDHLMPVAVVRFSSAALEARIAMAIERQRRAELHRLSARASEASLAVDWEQELEAAWSENESLREECATLSGQLAAALENLRAVAVHWAGNAVGDPVPAKAPEVERPQSVLQAVEWAASRCTGLVILDEALDSARRATYRQPARVLKALLAMDGAVHAWQQGQLEGGFRNAFAEQGLDYSHSLSPSTLGRFPHEYERTYLGKRIVLGPHIRLGRGSPEACCRIYFYLDEEAGVCVVGHVGNHLSDRTTG